MSKNNDRLKDLLLEREQLVCQAQSFLKMNQDADGNLSAADNKHFEEFFLKRKKQLDAIIDDEMQKPANEPVNIFLQDYFSGTQEQKNCKGVGGENYRQNFFTEIKTGCRTIFNTLKEAQFDKGGYLLPSEFHDKIISELQSENVLRQICNVIQTENDRKIAILSNSATADFIQEGAEINLSSESFTQKTLGAYKLACGVSCTNELLQDSFYDVESHLAQEFSKSIAAKEEDALLNGSGVNEPLGLIQILSLNSGTMTKTTSGNSISADDLISLCYSLKRPYRKNACWLMSDNTLAEVRKLKNSVQDYLFSPSLEEKTPDRLLGYPVYSSEFMPNIAGGSIPIIFGDFTRFIVGQRGEIFFKPLFELHALRDLSTFLMIERVDGILTDSHAIRGLKIKS